MTVTARVNNAAANAQEASQPRAKAYTAGFADALGERQLVFDPAAGSSLEILRLQKEFADSPEFEAALHLRVELARHVQHASLASVHGIERSEDGGLALVSKHVSGRRVSELLPKAHGAAFALELIRLVTPALAALHRSGDGVAHGALSAERIVVTRDGRLVVIEHVLGSAIESLKLSRQRLNELGLVAPSAGNPVRFDGRSDMMQLGFVALSLLLGRRLDPADCPAKVPALLDEYAQSAGSPVLATKIRSWLEKAMQISARSFASAKDAQAAFGDLPDDVDVRVAESGRGLLAFPSETPPSPMPIPAGLAKPAATPDRSMAHASPATPAKNAAASAPARVLDSHEPPRRGLGRIAIWSIAALALVAIGEGVALFVLPALRSQSPVIEVRAPQAVVTSPAVPSPAPVTPAQTANAATGSIGSGAAAAAPAVAPKSETAAPENAAPVAAGPRFGGLTVTSPLELQVFTGGKLVGSTSGPIALNEGPHSLEFVNETLGFRLQQSVNVKNGQMTSVKIAAPNGRISINAVPWAEVTIDGVAAGDTPLANLSLPIGTHEIVFKHPQLGERKQTVVVKVDGLLRVTQTFQQNKD
jgi:serine/threonine-protein kinase